MTEPMRMLSR
ncbi:hypothetical protein LINPERHAP2_LOCUS39645 [Linum perenne]